MTENTALFANSKKSKTIFLLIVLAGMIWILGKTINIYHFAAVAAIFEILWLPVIASILILTIMSLIYWIKDKFNFRSLNLYSLLLVVIVILFTIL